MYLIFDFDGVIGDTKETSIQAKMRIKGMSYEVALASDMEYATHKPNHTRDHLLTPEQLHEGYVWTANFGTAMLDIGVTLFTTFVHEVEQLPTPYKAVVSSGSQLYVIPALGHTNINPTHILAYENHHSKEEKIETVCADWGVTPAEIYYFTDTLADVYELRDMIPKQQLIGVAWGYCGKELLLRELQPQYILETPADLHRILNFTDSQK